MDKKMEFEKLRSIIVEVLNVDEDEITMNTTFVDDLGADSLDVFQIITGIEDEFDIEIPQEEAEKIVSVGDAVEQIKNAIGWQRMYGKAPEMWGFSFGMDRKERKSVKKQQLEQKIGYHFQNEAYLEQALRHSSYTT